MLSYPATVILTCIRFFVTLPYQRLLIYNTVQPAQEIKKLASKGIGPKAPGRRELWVAILSWGDRKRDELQFVAVAATVMTAIITASFSWPNVPSSHWTGPAFWYASLSLCISAIFLSSQQLSLLSLMKKKDPTEEKDSTPEWERESATVTIRRHLRQILKEKLEVTPNKANDEGDPSTGGEAIDNCVRWGFWSRRFRSRKQPDIETPPEARDMTQTQEPAKDPTIKATKSTTGLSPQASAATRPGFKEQPTLETIILARWTFSWKIMFVWQCPVMLIAYSTVFYMVGLFVVVCTPVLEVRKWGPESYVAVVYMASLGVSVWLFGFCSYGAYDYIHDNHGPGRNFFSELVQRIRILSNGILFSTEDVSANVHKA